MSVSFFLRVARVKVVNFSRYAPHDYTVAQIHHILGYRWYGSKTPSALSHIHTTHCSFRTQPPRTRFTSIASHTLHLHRLTMQVECLTHTLQFEPHICTSRASPQAAAMLVVVRVISHGTREHARSGAVATARVHLHASCLEWRRLRRRLQERPFRHLGLR